MAENSSQRELDDFARRAATATVGIRAGEPFFLPGEQIVAARAPGRLDVIGGIADYSGSLVLELPAREATLAAVQASEGGLEVVSRMDGAEGVQHFQLPAKAWRALLASDYDSARHQLGANRSDAWAAYVVGVLMVLSREASVPLGNGLRILIESTVPVGKGLSSSAAIEVATARATATSAGVVIAGEELARLCQLAENRVVGAPCGIMDQMTSALGGQGELFALLCQPAIVEGGATIPSSLGVWGVDSGIRHAVSGADYGSVRTGAFMGYRVLAELAGLETAAGEIAGTIRIRDRLWHGFLANVGPGVFESEFAARLPERMSGREFLDRYGGITDSVTAVDPKRDYAIRGPTAHPIYEHARVMRFRELLPGSDEEAIRLELGHLMYAAHDSYTACGLGSAGTDELVQMAKDAGPTCGVYGAKITGGGSGGTVAILARADAGPIVDDISRRYAARSGRASAVFSGSSNGACLTPCARWD